MALAAGMNPSRLIIPSLRSVLCAPKPFSTPKIESSPEKGACGFDAGGRGPRRQESEGESLVNAVKSL